MLQILTTATILICITVAATAQPAAAPASPPVAVAPPEDVASSYLMERSIVLFRSTVSKDGKTALVIGAVPSGMFVTCAVKLVRTGTDPAANDDAQWRISNLTCPADVDSAP